MIRTLIFGVCLATSVQIPTAAAGPYLATGIKIGEVTTNSAIVWVRLSESSRGVAAAADAEAPNPSVEDEAIPSLAGAAPGMEGEVRLAYSIERDFARPVELPVASVGAGTD